MGLMKKTILATLAIAASAASLHLQAEPVEVVLMDRLDGDLHDYCIDVNGPPHRLELEVPIQTHTCYSYRADPPPPTVDQAMDTDDIANGKIHLFEIGLCGEVTGDQPGARIMLTECEDTEEQSFLLKENGHFIWNASHYDPLNPELCLTAGAASWLGGATTPSRHQVRTLSLQPCTSEAGRYQHWYTRAVEPM
ncbi:MAG: RICIN domain-containing protein [Porticoccaceae bacterium]|jgi:hypothetical protein|nr:RICIN domain-containing protein [Porticoccaceae bacterium]